MQRIEVGETIKLKGEECVVESIGDRTVTLKLLSRADRDVRHALLAGERLDDLRKSLNDRPWMTPLKKRGGK